MKIQDCLFLIIALLLLPHHSVVSTRTGHEEGLSISQRASNLEKLRSHPIQFSESDLSESEEEVVVEQEEEEEEEEEDDEQEEEEEYEEDEEETDEEESDTQDDYKRCANILSDKIPAKVSTMLSGWYQDPVYAYENYAYHPSEFKLGKMTNYYTPFESEQTSETYLPDIYNFMIDAKRMAGGQLVTLHIFQQEFHNAAERLYKYYYILNHFWKKKYAKYRESRASSSSITVRVLKKTKKEDDNDGEVYPFPVPLGKIVCALESSEASTTIPFGIITERISGSQIWTKMGKSEGNLDLPWIQYTLRKILEAISFMHDHCIYHGRLGTRFIVCSIHKCTIILSPEKTRQIIHPNDWANTTPTTELEDMKTRIYMFENYMRLDLEHFFKDAIENLGFLKSPPARGHFRSLLFSLLENPPQNAATALQHSFFSFKN